MLIIRFVRLHQSHKYFNGQRPAWVTVIHCNILKICAFNITEHLLNHFNLHPANHLAADVSDCASTEECAQACCLYRLIMLDKVPVYEKGSVSG
jgi:hypothetical protein